MPDLSAIATPWWRIAIDVAIAVGTVGAVVVALFGQAFRGKFFPPKLTLSLANALGEATRVTITPPSGSPTQPREEEARYYHLRARNLRTWSPATDARVVLLRVEEPGPDGNLQVRWTGDIPLSWRHGTVFPPFRVIGPDVFADLCGVVRGKWLHLAALMSPHNLETIRRTRTDLVVSVQLHATQANSDVLRIRISWDGGFASGAHEMRRHLTVEQIA